MKGSPIIGRTAGLSALASGETPALLVAVKPGGIGNLNVAAGISAVAQALAAQSAAQAAEIADLICCAYALQSCWLRDAKFEAAGQGNVVGVPTRLLASHLYATRAFGHVISAASQFGAARDYLPQLCAAQAAYLSHGGSAGVCYGAGHEAVLAEGYPVA